jgi:hypothetical protein
VIDRQGEYGLFVALFVLQILQELGAQCAHHAR